MKTLNQLGIDYTLYSEGDIIERGRKRVSVVFDKNGRPSKLIHHGVYPIPENILHIKSSMDDIEDIMEDIYQISEAGKYKLLIDVPSNRLDTSGNLKFAPKYVNLRTYMKGDIIRHSKSTKISLENDLIIINGEAKVDRNVVQIKNPEHLNEEMEKYLNLDDTLEGFEILINPKNTSASGRIKFPQHVVRPTDENYQEYIELHKAKLTSAVNKRKVELEQRKAIYDSFNEAFSPTETKD